MSEFILEIGTEEMPARFVPGLADELQQYMAKELNDAMVDHTSVFSYGTPRRIVVHVTGIAQTQRLEEEEVSGPPARIAYDADGNPTKAGLGFAKSQGVEMDDVYTVETDKGEYLAVTRKVGGQETRAILGDLCVKCISALSFPKKMRWGTLEYGFGRPLRWFLALFDEQVIDFTIAEITSGRETYGHRVMGPGPFAIDSADEYFRTIHNKCNITLDPEERKSIIREHGDRLATAKGGAIVWKDDLLDEDANLVEYPRPLLGDFDELYLELPEEVLLTSMQSHQKSFGVRGEDGKLMPFFLTVLNLEPKDPKVVEVGWERVLKARLEDARFFWEADKATDFSAWKGKLDKVTFLQPLGSMGQKSSRIESLCGYLADNVDPALKTDCMEAAKYCKCDLVSEMVYEFDSLQGIMGGIYASRKGMNDVVASAISEQYLPAGPDTPVPGSKAGALVAIADRIDTMAGCFGLKMIPTGGADPYALRRAALGIIRIVLEHDLELDLEGLVKTAFEQYVDVKWKIQPEDATPMLVDFIGQRLKAFYTGRDIETLVVEACLEAGYVDIKAFDGRLMALDAFSRQDGFADAVLTFKRAANIIRKQAGEAGVELSGKYDASLFEEDAETALATALGDVTPRFEAHWAEGEYEALMGLLAELRPAVDGFFDNVMVMCDNEDVRLNRLNLLHALVGLLSRLADFNALQM